jgi:hypothetical protein
MTAGQIAKLFLALSICVAVSALYYILLAKVIGHFLSKQRARGPVKVPVGSYRLLDVRNLRGRPIIATIAVVTGTLGTLAAILCCSGAFPGHPEISGISYVVMFVSAIVVGIIFGTNDRDFYA